MRPNQIVRPNQTLRRNQIVRPSRNAAVLLVAVAGLSVGAAGAHAQTAFTWTAPTDGNWSDTGRWTPTGSPGASSSLDAATLGGVGAYTVTLDTSRTISLLNIPNSQVSLVVFREQLVISSATIAVGARVTVGSNTTLFSDVGRLTLENGVTFDGELVLNSLTSGTNAAFLTGSNITGQSAVLGPSAVVSGKGEIDGNIINAGHIIVSSSGMEIRLNTLKQTATGVIRAEGGGRIDIRSNPIEGGAIEASPSGVIFFNDNRVRNMAFRGDFNIFRDQVIFGSGIDTQGARLTVGSDTPFFSDVGRLTLENGVTFDGELVLNSLTSGTNAALLVGPNITGQSAVLGPAAVVSGKGEITGSIVNAGHIIVSSSEMEIQLAAIKQTATGVIRAEGGGRIDIRSNPIEGGAIEASPSGVIFFNDNRVRNMAFRGDFNIFRDQVIFGSGIDTQGARLTVGSDTPFFSDVGRLTLENGVTFDGELVLNSMTSGTNAALLVGPNITGQSAVLGPAAVVSGKGEITGSFTPFAGTLSPGTATTAGLLNIGNAFTWIAGAETIIDIGGRATAEFDRITGSSKQLNGTLTVRALNAFEPVFGDEFEIITGSSISGSFSLVEVPTPANPSLRYGVRYEASRVLVVATCFADFSFDLQVDSGDLALFITAFVAQDPAADVTNDGQVDSGDLAAFIGLFLGGC